MLVRFGDWQSDWQNLPGFSGFTRSSAPFSELRRDLLRLFSNFEREAEFSTETRVPDVGLTDIGNAIVLNAELPGVVEEDLEITALSNSVTIKAKRSDKIPEGYVAHRRERSSYQFARSYELPVKVEAERAEATLKNGILTLKLPKVPEAQPKRISVKGAS